MGFRENLKDELKYQDIRVKELAEKSGVSKRVIDHYLAEKYTEPQAVNAVKIAAVLGVSVEYLVTGRDSSVPLHIRPKVAELVRDANRLGDEDVDLVQKLITRLRRNGKSNTTGG